MNLNLGHKNTRPVESHQISTSNLEVLRIDINSEESSTTVTFQT